MSKTLEMCKACLAKLLAIAIVLCNKLIVRVGHIMHTSVDILLITNIEQNIRGDAYIWSDIQLHVNYLGTFTKSCLQSTNLACMYIRSCSITTTMTDRP